VNVQSDMIVAIQRHYHSPYVFLVYDGKYATVLTLCDLSEVFTDPKPIHNIRMVHGNKAGRSVTVCFQW
jgi:hypothetical protein